MPTTAPARTRLNSWKEIAAYLNTTSRTVQRWEKNEALPVHRHLHALRHSVYAHRSEIDEWWTSRGASLPEPQTASPTAPRRPWGILAVLGVGIAAGAGFWALRPVESSPAPKSQPEVPKAPASAPRLDNAQPETAPSALPNVPKPAAQERPVSLKAVPLTSYPG